VEGIVSQAGTTIPTDSLSPDVDSHTFSQIRSALIKVLRTSPEAREPLCDALELLETVQQQVEVTRQAPARGGELLQAPARKRTKLQEYEIQWTDEGEFLIERRPGHSQPFRCPRDTYEAAAKVLADAEGALHFDELMDRLNGRLPQRQPDYRLRVALRFWMAAGAIARYRTRYKATNPREFPQASRRLWENLLAERAAPMAN
jgi:hypothetical protein